MPCQRVTLPGIGHAIVCGPGPRVGRCACGRPGTQLCDWKVAGKRSGTCDVPVCSNCTHVPAPDKDLCPEHAAAWLAWQSERTAAAGVPT